MEILNEMKVEFLSRSANESFARVTVSAFISQLDPTVTELSDIKTAVSEAVTNSIIHGYENNVGIIKIMVRIFSGRIVEITITDKGTGIEDISLARQPLYTTGKSDERSGMGFTVMETFMDDVQVSSKKGEGTRVVLKRCLS